jgi:NitT/TauT family transport system substrate-binding protein
MRIRAIEDAVGVMLQSGRVTKDVGSNPGTVAVGQAIVDILSRITRREVLKSLRFAALLLALAAPITPARAGQSVSLILNWTPAADHSPFYYAKSQGWYERAGIDLSIEVGKGSGVSSLKVGSGGAPFGISDLATMLVARSKGADAVALMSIYANTGQTFYWLKSYGVNGPKDFAGRKIGNPPGDASRVMWPAFAKAAGLAPDSVTFVNVGPTAKSAALKGRIVEIISDFYNSHDIKLKEFGSDLGSLNWKDIGLNSYGNSLIVNGAFLEKNPKLSEDFVRITQKAYAACVADFEPCLKALLDQASGHDKENQQRQWERIKFLMTDDFTTTKALGWIDAERMKKDYELVQTYLGMEKPFDVNTAFSVKMLDTNVKMDASKVKK